MDPAPSLPTAANAAANALPRQRLTNAFRALPFDCLLPRRWHSDLGQHHRQAHSRSRCPLATLPAQRTRPLRTNTEYPEVVRVEQLAGDAGQRKLGGRVDWALSSRKPGFG